MSRITAYMATMPGREQALRTAVRSLAPQVGYLYIMSNIMDGVASTYQPEFPNVILQLCEDIGDRGKFYHADIWDGFVLTVDDDILYPPDYVQTMLREIEAYERRAVIGYHGRIVKGDEPSFFRAKRQYIHFVNNTPKDVGVNLIGTGVMGLHTDALDGELIDWSKVLPVPNVSDISFSAEMNRRGIPLVCARKRQGWLQQIAVPHTIANRQLKDDTIETELLHSFNWPAPCQV